MHDSPQPPSILPVLGRGSVRLPDRLTGLPPASPPSSRAFRPPRGQCCRRPTGAAAASACSLLRFLPSSSGFPSPPRVARRKPARCPASSLASPSRPMGPRSRAAAPAPWRWRTERAPRRAGGKGGRQGRQGRAGERREVSAVGPAAPAPRPSSPAPCLLPPARGCAIWTCHVGATAAAAAPRYSPGEWKTGHALLPPFTHFHLLDFRAEILK